ncbi:MAG: hypothetical protein IIA88_06845 [Bacteroidetes bacterium]|nr:hypothetical protein [Bacteroidota bacterium]
MKNNEIDDKKLTIWIEIFKMFSIFLIVLVTGISGILFKNTFLNNKIELILLYFAGVFLFVVIIIFFLSLYKLIKYLIK